MDGVENNLKVKKVEPRQARSGQGRASCGLCALRYRGVCRLAGAGAVHGGAFWLEGSARYCFHNQQHATPRDPARGRAEAQT